MLKTKINNSNNNPQDIHSLSLYHSRTTRINQNVTCWIARNIPSLEQMDCKINPQCKGGINCHVYDSLNCKGCCSGGDGSPLTNKKHAHFFKELVNGDKNYATENQQSAVGICACCKDPPCQPFPKSCQNFGGPVLLYEIPSPKFEGVSIHQQDFRPKPVPVKEMPPWHPILKDRWKAIDVPSFNKSTYQSDFTPQVVTQECRKPVYLAPKVKK
ncbi:hypothetical protein HNY73_019958 [Argiope bruennichi]|uniref:Uncharacterized protein n=1 Tax=Argiope bruennichi TaxID=94029 RepID=A0A8T0E595_ARGBR|nr:hypothetical protein HNY73_019958 [Argiope bruennichi]